MSGDFVKYLALSSLIGLFLWAYLVVERRRLASPSPDALKRELHDVHKRVSRIETEVGEVREGLQDKASRSDLEAVVEKVETNLAAVKQIATALPDIESRQRALADTAAEMKTDLAVTKASINNVEKQLNTIMGVIVPKGMAK